MTRRIATGKDPGPDAARKARGLAIPAAETETPPRRSSEARVELPAGQGPLRADRYISEVIGILSRSQLKARGAIIEVNGKVAKLSRILSDGDRVVVSWTEEPSSSLVPENIPLAILYEDDRVIVVDKAQGMVTHPGAGNRRGTLANAVLGHLEGQLPSESPTTGGALRGGIVHRLDKDTSGVIIVAKDAETQAFLAAQFKDRTTRKDYLAITFGVPKAGPKESKDRTWHRIESRLGRDRRDRKRFAEVEAGGKPAVTDWRILATYGDFALVHLRPRTGRTHQLRVHLAALGCPIVGDPIYGRPGRDSEKLRLGGGAPTLMLHAWRLAIRLPGPIAAQTRDVPQPSLDEAGRARFVAPPPDRFRRLVRLLGNYGKKKKPPSD